MIHPASKRITVVKLTKFRALALAVAFTNIAVLAGAATHAQAEPAAPDAVGAVMVDDPNRDAGPSVSAQAQKEDARTVHDANKFANAQSAAVNSVPGVSVDSTDLKEKPVKKKMHLNPIHWVFGPVIELQEQTTRLQQQMIKLTGPIASLQPAMLTLQKQVVSVNTEIKGTNQQLQTMQGELSDVRTRMDRIESGINVTNRQMKGMETEIKQLQGNISAMQHFINGTYVELQKMHPDITLVRTDMGKIREPIMKIQGPLTEMAQPIGRIDKRLGHVQTQLDNISEPLHQIESPITGIGGELAGLHAEIKSLRDLLSMILTAILISAGLTIVGTPIVAILVWRNKHKLLPPPAPERRNESQTLTSSSRR